LRDVPAYETELISDKPKIQYLFESHGVKIIIKAIEYTPVRKIGRKMVFNLGFGDYDEDSGKILDDANSNNGDMRKVFSTVLDTIPKFFQENPNSAIWVQGSDSVEDFRQICEPSCGKKCTYHCKNVNRRMKAYRYYVEKHFVTLTTAYSIFGYSDETGTYSKYVAGIEYSGILIYRKK
jgi:hypothetical protein